MEEEEKMAGGGLGGRCANRAPWKDNSREGIVSLLFPRIQCKTQQRTQGDVAKLKEGGKKKEIGVMKTEKRRGNHE